MLNSYTWIYWGSEQILILLLFFAVQMKKKKKKLCGSIKYQFSNLYIFTF